jgi:hypothetical protein
MDEKDLNVGRPFLKKKYATRPGKSVQVGIFHPYQVWSGAFL